MVSVSEGIAIATRRYSSVTHCWAAGFLAAEASSKQTKERPPEPHNFEAALFDLKACATASIISSAAFLEATICELFTDAVDGQNMAEFGTPAFSVRPRLSYAWTSRPTILRRLLGRPTRQLSRAPTLEKFQVALDCMDKSRFNKGQTPFQEAAALISLRNALVHPKPETLTVLSSIPENPITMSQVQLRMRPLLPDHPWFVGEASDEWLTSAGAAKWGVTTAIRFADDFCKRTELKAPYHNVRAYVSKM